MFCTPFGFLLGHVVCKEGLLVDQAKIAVIVDMPPPTLVKTLHATLGHTGYYYRQFIFHYAKITMPMEKLLNKDAKFIWTRDYQKAFDVLKENMVIVPILIFLDWN